MRRSIGLVRIFLLAILGTSVAMAQQAQTLSGRVTDQTSAPIPQADVVIEQSAKLVAQLKSDQHGKFSFHGDPGEYQVTVGSPGFRPITRKEFTFKIASATPVVMDVGSFSGVRIEPTQRPGVSASTATYAAMIDPVSDVAQLRAPTVAAQLVDGADAVRDGAMPWNFGVLAQGGVGLTEDRGSFRFLMAGVRAGKVLTATAGSGVLRGNFELGAEVFPLWQSYTPVMQRQNCLPIAPGSTTVQCSNYFNVGGTYTGVSITPAILRWNFAGWGRVTPWVQGAGGVVWTNHKYPGFGGPPGYPPGTVLANPSGGAYTYNSASADTSVWNFTPQFGVGMHWFMRPKRSVDFGANAIHISSASLGDRNPGVNASVQFSLGYSWWK